VKKPLLSVCVITYNHANYIKEALDSILSQKVSFDWELIVADDFSTDGTRDILKEYKKKYSNIKLILQKKNVGPEKNWLDLMSYPKTKYVLYTEGDDYMTDLNKLQRQVDFLEAHKDFSLCFHPVRVVYEDGSKPDEGFPPAEFRFNKTVLGIEDLIIHNFMQTNSVMYRWRFVDENIKDVFPRNVAPGDWVLHILHAQKGKIGFTNNSMSVYRRHKGSLWWDSEGNRSRLWQKYAIPHMRAYDELLKRSDDNPESKKALQKSMNSLFEEVLNMTEVERSELVHTLLSEFPKAAETFILYHKEAIDNKNKKISELHGIIDENYKDYKKLSNKLHETKVALEKANIELLSIKNSRTWRVIQKSASARNAVKIMKPRKTS
jgi:glycosyltransferase involved in cell wall biosynthesis